LKTGFELTRVSTNPRARGEEATHLARAVGIAYWRLGEMEEARRWYGQAQGVQQDSGRAWIPALSREIATLDRLLDESRR